MSETVPVGEYLTVEGAEQAAEWLRRFGIRCAVFPLPKSTGYLPLWIGTLPVASVVVADGDEPRARELLEQGSFQGG